MTEEVTQNTNPDTVITPNDPPEIEIKAREMGWRPKDEYRDWETDRKSTRLNSSHSAKSRMPSSA